MWYLTASSIDLTLDCKEEGHEPIEMLSPKDTGKTILPGRHFATSNHIAQKINGDNSSSPLYKNGASAAGAKPINRQTDRDLFLSVLNATPTRRDAKSYLSRFNPGLAGAAYTGQEPASINDIHVALVKIRALQDLDDNVVDGVAHTLSHLAQLGLRSIVIPDCIPDGQNSPGESTSSLRNIHREQANRIVSAIDSNDAFRAVPLDILGISPNGGSVNISSCSTLLRSLAVGKIPVVAPIAYTYGIHQAVDVPPDEVMLALTKELIKLSWNGANRDQTEDQTSEPSLPQANNPTLSVSVDKIILLDPLGGLPSTSRPDKSHVFVNLEQEYRDIRKEFQDQYGYDKVSKETTAPSPSPSLFGQSNPLTQFAEQEVIPTISTNPTKSLASLPQAQHVQNLDFLQKALNLLPPSSSALLTSAEEAAIPSPSEQAESAASLGVRTRSPKNPLIFNLLTDKPLISSSLPTSRLKPSSESEQVRPSRATFVKRGMSVTMIPDPRKENWEPPTATKPCISLVNDSRVDFSRLLALIEDSFNKPLDVQHFLNRVQNRIAGVIVAGEYEGGALLTWELPPGVPDDGSEESRRRMVPYLDKFAVLKRSQGAGGVADVVFSAMVRSCFPHGVCWRSRKNNPVNKWYFERARGTWKLPDSDWTMFWTTPDLLQDEQKFMDYEGVCRNVGPSWADRKSAN